MILHVRILAPTGEVVRDLSVSAFPARRGRDPASEIPMDASRFPTVSALHACIDLTPDGPVLLHQSRKNETVLNDRALTAPAMLKPGDRIRLGNFGPTVEVVGIEVRADWVENDVASTLASSPAQVAALRASVTVLPSVAVGASRVSR